MRSILLLFCVLLLSSCNDHQKVANKTSSKPHYVTSLSISSDGKYAISAHADNRIVLWDIPNRTQHTLSTSGNLFSAYFIRNSNLFIWQDLSNIVYVQNTNGDTIKSFKQFPVYGQVMSRDLEHYYSSDQGWGIYSGYGKQMTNIKHPTEGDYIGYGKLLNLTLNVTNTLLLQSGDLIADIDKKFTLHDELTRDHYGEMDGVVIWDLIRMKPIQKISANNAKTYATFSPDGQYVVSGDENVKLLVWDIKQRKLKWKGAWLEADSPDQPKVPKGYLDFDHHHAIICVKFIDIGRYFLRFNTYEPYALLYDIDNPNPIKYLALGNSPFPSVSDYDRNTAIDSSPETGIVVTGQRDGGGIIVYQFDKKNLELHKVWVTQ